MDCNFKNISSARLTTPVSNIRFVPAREIEKFEKGRNYSVNSGGGTILRPFSRYVNQIKLEPIFSSLKFLMRENV